MDWPLELACDIGLTKVRSYCFLLPITIISTIQPVISRRTIVQSAISAHEISSGKSTDRQQLTIHPTCWSPTESPAKATLVDGYTKLVTDRVKAKHSHVFLASWPAISRHQSDEGRGPGIYGTLLTRVRAKPRTASSDRLPVLIGAVDLSVNKLVSFILKNSTPRNVVYLKADAIGVFRRAWSSSPR
jgi:hypothetical protein